ncbi:MAG: two-component regulator propeller domain-containing protein, partial [Bacteroidota bacterium]
MAFSTMAQELSHGSNNFTLQEQSFSTKDGLSHPSVTAFAQDAYGFIWMSTPDGLNRYDGQSFKVYRKKSHGLQSNNIRRVMNSPDSLLWLFYPEGANGFQAMDVFDPISGQVSKFEKHYEGQLPDEIATFNFGNQRANEDGSIWLGSDHYLYEYDGLQFQELLELPDSLFIAGMKKKAKATTGVSGWLI